MTDFFLENHLTSELKYHVRKRVAEECRKRSPEGDPMVSGITVMLGCALAMAAFTAILGRGKSGRTR